MTQEELGELLGEPQAFISKVETCERRLDLLEAVEWCLALGIKLDDILPPELRTRLTCADGEDAHPGGENAE